MTGASTARAPWALLAAFGGCLLYASADQGATAPAAQSWLVLALSLTATGALAAWLYGNGLKLEVSRLGLVGLALLAGFAVWAAVSIAFSVAPDRSWTQANTVFGYALAVLIGVLLGSSLPRALQRVGLTIAFVMLPIALYAFGGKAFPGVSILGFSFDHAAALNRLSAPLGYWNALALACVSGLLPLLRCAADPWRGPRARVAALLGVYLFALVIGMTYSRGGVIALAAGAAVFVALTTERMRTLVLLASAALATVFPLTIALGRRDLITDGLPLGQRTDDATVLLLATLAVALLLAAWARALIVLEADRRFTPARGRAIGRPLAYAAAILIAVAGAGFIASGRAATTVDGFTDVTQAAGVTDPGRLLTANSGNRWVWWREAAGAWSDRPVIGWGAGSFPVTHRLYRKASLSVAQPHNVALQWLAENGLVGFGLGVGALGALLAAGLARIRAIGWRLSGAPQERGAAAALLAIAAAWIVQSFVEWSWDIPAVTLPMFVALGVLAARPSTRSPRPMGARGPAMVAVTAALVLVALSALLPAIADTRTQNAVATAAEADASDATLADAATEADLSARLNPLATDGLVAAATIAVRRDRPAEARDYLLRAVRRQPYDVRSWTQLAAVELERGDVSGVRRAVGRALELDPASPFTVSLALQTALTELAPAQSATATGAPLPTEVVVSDQDVIAP